METQTTALRLVQTLEEELDQFPLASVIRSHADLTERALCAWSEHVQLLGGPGRRFWDHLAELMYDEVGVLLGAAFVLVQAGITETVSIVKRIYELNGQTIGKTELMSLEAMHAPDSTHSYVVIANAAANFYKHRFEWSRDWLGCVSSQQQATINLIRDIGMRPDIDLADNLFCAVRAITGSDTRRLGDLASLVVEQWRARLAPCLRIRFQLPTEP